jgi:hypothetical protein
MTTYRVGDDSPPLEWFVSADLSGATVTATYTNSVGETNSYVCTSVPYDLELNNKIIHGTKITHEWGVNDLDVAGIGKLQLRWATANDTGSLHPIEGWRIEVLP